MFRLRVVEGLTLDQIGERFHISASGCASSCGCTSVWMECRLPRKGERPTKLRPSTLGERRRLYLLARVAVKRYYHEP